MLISQIFNIVFGLYIFFLLLRVFIAENVFYFNPALRPVYMLTQPVIDPLRKALPALRSGFDYIPFVAIAALIVVKGLITGVFNDWTLSFAFYVSLNELLRFMYTAFLLIFVTAAILGPYAGGVIGGYLYRIVNSFQRLGWYFRLRNRQLAFFLIFPTILTFMLLWTGLEITFASLSSSGQTPTPGKALQVALLVVFRLFNIYQIMMILGIILSWVRPPAGNPLVDFLVGVVDAFCRPFRRYIPPIAGLDFTPILVFILLTYASRIGNELLFRLPG